MTIKPIPVPKTGTVQKLKLNVAPGQADVFVHQTPWPKQKENPNWRIEVTRIDGRHDQETQIQIRKACEDVARVYLKRWLKQQAPLLTLDTVTWSELVKFATMKRFTVLSAYQIRRLGKTGTHKYPIESEIEMLLDDEEKGEE